MKADVNTGTYCSSISTYTGLAEFTQPPNEWSSNNITAWDIPTVPVCLLCVLLNTTALVFIILRTDCDEYYSTMIQIAE